MNELRNRGVDDILLAVVDGLKGFPDAIRAVFPEAMVQTCIVGSLKKLSFGGDVERSPEGIGHWGLPRVRPGLARRGRRHRSLRAVWARTRQWRQEGRPRAA